MSKKLHFKLEKFIMKLKGLWFKLLILLICTPELLKNILEIFLGGLKNFI